MREVQRGNAINSEIADKKRLWRAAIKLPMYSVAIMPAILAAGLRLSNEEVVRFDQLIGFLVASTLLLLWENLSNDIFDAKTGVDNRNKPHSIVALVNNSKIVHAFAYCSLFTSIIITIFLTKRSSPEVILLFCLSGLIGYIYQGPPFRLGYKGLGEPLCWIAFGPLATSAALMVIRPQLTDISPIPWKEGLTLGAGPALATTLVLFCSHFHQVKEDAAAGKYSPVVILGTKRSASLIPWIITLIILLEIIPIFTGEWPITSLLLMIGLPHGIKLITFLKRYHDNANLISNSKFIALRFQILNGLGLTFGFVINKYISIN